MGGVIKSIGSIFSKPKAPKITIPKVQKTRRRPVESDAAKVEARRRQRAQFRKRKGRESTILSDDLREMTGSSGQSLGG